MSFDRFKAAICRLVRKSMDDSLVEFSDNGNEYTASLPDGTRITGNPNSNRIAIRWGRGFQ